MKNKINLKITKRNSLISLFFLAVILIFLPFILGYFGNAWVRILSFSMLYIMLALGLNIVIGYAGLLDLGYVAFYAVGAYLFALLTSPHLAENFVVIQQIFPTGLPVPSWTIIFFSSTSIDTLSTATKPPNLLHAFLMLRIFVILNFFIFLGKVLLV